MMAAKCAKVAKHCPSLRQPSNIAKELDMEPMKEVLGMLFFVNGKLNREMDTTGYSGHRGHYRAYKFECVSFSVVQTMQSTQYLFFSWTLDVLDDRESSKERVE